MSRRTWPQMRPSDWRTRLAVVEESPWPELEAAPVELLPKTLTWEATGPPRVTRSEIAALRNALREAATEVGYRYGREDGPPPAMPDQKSALDLALARTLSLAMPIAPNEAARSGVWRYVATMVAPELVRWRFEDGGSTSRARYSGKVVRNLFSRLWWRAYILRDDDATDPLWLLDELYEDEQVAIVERANAAGYRPLAIGLGRTLIEVFDASVHGARTHLMREAMKRMVRWLRWTALEALDEEALADVLRTMFYETMDGLGLPRRSPQAGLGLTSGTAPARAADSRVDAAMPAPAQVGLASGTPDADSPSADRLERAAVVVRLLPDAAIEALRGDLLPGVSDVPRVDLIGPLAAAPGVLEEHADAVPAQALLSVCAPGSAGSAVGALTRWMMGDNSPHDDLTHGELDLAAAEVRGGAAEPPPVLVDPDEEDTSDEPTEEMEPGATQPDAHPILDGPLPAPPPLAERIVEHLGVATPREAAAVRREDALQVRGVGRTKWTAWRDWVRPWREQLQTHQLAEGTLPICELPQPPPSFLSSVVRQMSDKTVAEVLVLDPEDLLLLRGVGHTKVAAFRDWQEELRTQVQEAGERTGVRLQQSPEVQLVPSAPAVHDASQLVNLVLEEVDERERLILVERLFRQQTLSQIGDTLSLSRERVRQIGNRSLRVLKARFGGAASRLLQEEWRHGHLGPGILHHSVSNGPTVPWFMVPLLAELAEDARWSVVDEDWLTTHSSSELRALRDAVKAVGVDRLALPEDAFDDLVDRERDITKAFCGLVLATETDFDAVPAGGWRRDRRSADPRTVVLDILQQAEGPMHQTDIARALLAATSTDGEQPDEDALLSAVRSVEGACIRLPDVLRVDRGTFAHRRHVRLDSATAEEATRIALDRLRGSTGPVSTVVLLDAVDAAGVRAPDLNPYVLKELLRDQPGVVVLRKSHLAWEDTWSEEGVQLADRVEAVLRDASRPLSADEVYERLPSELAYSRNSVTAVLYDGEVAESVSRGRFTWVGED